MQGPSRHRARPAHRDGGPVHFRREVSIVHAAVRSPASASCIPMTPAWASAAGGSWPASGSSPARRAARRCSRRVALAPGRRSVEVERARRSAPGSASSRATTIARVAERAVERAFAAIARVDRADERPSRRQRAVARQRARRVGDAVAGGRGACSRWSARARGRAARAGGVYDPTVLPLMRLYGFYGAARDALPRAIARSTRTLDADGLAARASSIARPGRWRSSARGAGLDLGSIGKGWAVDRAVGRAARRGHRAPGSSTWAATSTGSARPTRRADGLVGGRRSIP